MSEPRDLVKEKRREPSKLFWVGAILSFVISFTLYVKTMAASSSFWDAGEYIAAAYGNVVISLGSFDGCCGLAGPSVLSVIGFY